MKKIIREIKRMLCQLRDLFRNKKHDEPKPPVAPSAPAAPVSPTLVEPEFGNANTIGRLVTQRIGNKAYFIMAYSCLAGDTHITVTADNANVLETKRDYHNHTFYVHGYVDSTAPVTIRGHSYHHGKNHPDIWNQTV